MREARQFMITESSRKVLDQIYNDTGSWLPKWAQWLFVYRLRVALPTEDPFELLAAFTDVMGQHDFLDESRKGESIRLIAKRERMREVRAARAAEREAKAAEKAARAAHSRKDEEEYDFDDSYSDGFDASNGFDFD